ncbi:SusC/RagA family TonB-linked outer membrane protein [Flavobacterium sp. RHBU_3]|uniref:SusC/RagA family TonB-linked outer membrane protein n=1 Tax=Flavobacterium sp. RHBU_3 TaxID=3391184 RepID=UPI003984751A
MKTMYQKFLLLLLMVPFGLLAQTKNLTGTVRDNTSGQPLPGVNIIVEGTQNGTSTDMDGKYTLPNVAKGSKIVFSFIGYASQTIDYTGQASLDITLSEDATQLKEVVVIGYGTTTKKNNSAAVTTVKAEQFQKGPIVGAEQLIQGRVSGVQVTTGGGEPGSGSLVRIRSGASLAANSDPLYVVDGVPIEVGGGGSIGGRNALAAINQNDIESMTILKDAAATAIYGSRASNGVVIITTKKGKSGEMKVNYIGNFQAYQVGKTVDVLSADQYRNFVTTNGTPAQQALLGTANTDWQKQIYRTALGTDHNISAQGGNDNIVYRASMGYTNMNGILKTDNFQRTTLGANVTGNFFDKHLKIEVTNKSSIIYNLYADKSAIGAAVAFDPTQPVHQDNAFGNYFQWATNGAYEVNASRNPVAFLEQKHNYGNNFRSIGNAQLDYKIHGWEDMKLVANFGYDYASGRTYGDVDSDYVVTGEAGSSYETTQDTKIQNMDLYFNYNKYLESIKTNIELTGGYNYQDFKYSGSGSSYSAVNDITNYSIPYNNRLNLQSFFGRATFTIADKYILNGSYRADASSRFTDHPFGSFPAVSGAWKLSQENFLKDSKVISELKLRASWGITGQQDTGYLYPAAALYSVSTNTAAYQMGYDAAGHPVYYTTYSPTAYNKDLKWEQSTTTNFGVDFSLFNGRFTGTVEYYQRETKDLIVYAQNPQGVNFSNYAYYNIGNMKNKGLEIMADVYPVKTDNVTWRVGGNITFQNSEITKLNSQSVPGFPGYNIGGISGGVGTTIQNNQVGFWPNSYYVYEQAYDADGKPLEGVYVDRNNDGVINEKDKYRFHKPQADIFYGFNTDLSVGNWWFSTSFRGTYGNYNYNNVFSNTGNYATGLPTNGNYLNNMHTNALATNFNNPQYLSDYYVQNAAFLRWDNVTLGYTFKNVFKEGSTMQLTGAIQNVLVITGYKGIDPEIAGGIDNNFYPRPRIYTLGLNVNF